MKLAGRLLVLCTFCSVLAVGCNNATTTQNSGGGPSVPSLGKKDKTGLTPPPLPPAPP